MPEPESDEPNDIEALVSILEDNLQEDGIFYQFENEEIYAPYETALTFINEIIANAEPNFVAKKFIAVKAAMIEAGSWMRIITRLHLHTDLEMNEHRPETQTLFDAQDRMLKATARYDEAITAPTSPQDEDLLYLWQLTSASSAYAAMLRKHLEKLEQAGSDEKRAAAHNIAARNAFLNLGIFVAKLTEAAKTKTAGPRPSNRQAQRSIYGAREAILDFKNAKELINATKPVRRSVSLKDDDITEITREMINTMRLDGADHIINLDPQHPDRSLLLYDDNHVYRVKRVTDEYPLNTSIETAEAHTIIFMETIEELPGLTTETVEQIRLWSEITYNNTIAGLHSINRAGFAEMIRLIQEADSNPLTVREVTQEAIIHGNSGTDLLFLLSPQETDLVSDQQATQVINAARSAGVQDSQLRAICSAMGKTAQQMDINPASVSTEQMIAILDACPKEIHPHQVMTIARLLGVDREQEQLHLWIEQNCDIHDDHHDHEDEYDYDLEHLH